jgi:hypothetical protein
VDKAHFFVVNARIVQFKSEQDKMFYLACPSAECRRKVVPVEVSNKEPSYHCEYCKQYYRTCHPTYMLQAKIADFTDSLVVMFARDNATPIMGGLTPQQFLEFKQNQLEN